jgi:hypothetical protein
MSQANQHGPLLAPGAEPPGRFVNGQWQGQLDWCSRHGPAMVQWQIGFPTYVWNALGPDGRRVDLLGRYPASDQFRVDGAEVAVHGRILITPDDVEFVLVEGRPGPDLDDDRRALFDLLRSDQSFMADLSSPASAGALYHAIENTEFVAESGAVFAFGQRSAADFVAALRDVGEDYLDFAWGRGPGFTGADVGRVKAHLSRLGLVPRDRT